jgi:hypothetical protein
VWDAINTSGPACGVQTRETDVERYLELLDAFLAEVA